MPDSLDLLIKLSLAQAQECFWKKTVISKMKNNTIAKMAKAASNLYLDAYKLSNQNSIVTQSWISYILSKVYYLDAASLVRYSMVNYDNNQFGEEIARLMEAEKILLKIKSFKQNLNEDYYEDIKVLIIV